MNLKIVFFFGAGPFFRFTCMHAHILTYLGYMWIIPDAWWSEQHTASAGLNRSKRSPRAGWDDSDEAAGALGGITLKNPSLRW